MSDTDELLQDLDQSIGRVVAMGEFYRDNHRLPNESELAKCPPNLLRAKGQNWRQQNRAQLADLSAAVANAAMMGASDPTQAHSQLKKIAKGSTFANILGTPEGACLKHVMTMALFSGRQTFEATLQTMSNLGS